MLLERQLILYGKIVRLPDDHPTRLSIFQPGSFSPASHGVRRRGRPRYEWGHEIAKIVAEISSCAVMSVQMMIMNEKFWRNCTKTFCRASNKNDYHVYFGQ